MTSPPSQFILVMTNMTARLWLLSSPPPVQIHLLHPQPPQVLSTCGLRACHLLTIIYLSLTSRHPILLIRQSLKVTAFLPIHCILLPRVRSRGALTALLEPCRTTPLKRGHPPLFLPHHLHP